MEPKQVLHLIGHRFRRGMIICRVIGVVTVGFAGALVMTPGAWPWAIIAFIIANIFIVAHVLIGQKYLSAWKICENAGIVYWAHATDRHQKVSAVAVTECNFLTVHLRDGTECEVALPPKKMGKFVDWLKQRNPLIRWGAYDASDGENKKPRQ